MPASHALSSTGLVASATRPALVMSNFSWGPFLKLETLGVSSLVGGLTVLHQGLHLVQPRVANFLGFRNRGRLFSFKDGELISVQKVKKIKDRLLAYGIRPSSPCLQDLGTLEKRD